MLTLSVDQRNQFLHSLAVITGVATEGRETKVAALLNGVINGLLQSGPEITAEEIAGIKVKFEGKTLNLNLKQAVRVEAALSLMGMFEAAAPVRKRPEVQRSKNRKPARYHRETSSEEMLRISRLVVEWRIADTGQRSLSWRDIRGELGGLDEKELREVICASSEYRQAVRERINFLQSRPEGWEYVGKLSVLTRLNVETVDDI